MVAADLSPSTISSALDGVRVAYFDGRFPEAAVLLANEVHAISVSLSCSLWWYFNPMFCGLQFEIPKIYCSNLMFLSDWHMGAFSAL